jgi:FkbH-like protein
MTASVPTPEPVDSVLRSWHEHGLLARSYADVAGLLADADADQLRRSGAVLARLDADEIDRHQPCLPVATVVVTGSGTLSPLVAALHADLARHGFVPRVRVGGYRQYPMELRDAGNPLFGPEPDLTLCLLDAEEVFAGLSTPWTVADVQGRLAELAGELDRIATRYLADHVGLLVLNTIPLPRHWAAQVLDHRSKALLGASWREFNAQLLRMTIDRPGLVVLDSEPLLTEIGPLADPRLGRYTKSWLGAEFLAGYAKEIGHLVRALRGRTSKCLVLDLDGTVWGGTLADDGPEGVAATDGLRGEAFHAFQLVATQIGSQGPLLAVCSKNDAALVQTALRDIPGLGLRAEDMVAVIANWGPKPDNLRQLAEQLNIGVDSLVFVDDSAAERGAVRMALPAVAVVAVDPDEPALHVQRLLADGWFTTLEVTEEDRLRGQRYRTERQRLEFQERTDSLDDYLAGLGTTVTLSRAGEGDIGRIAQLTQRTNQFNLTTVRMDPAAVRRVLDDPLAGVFMIRCTDRFGGHGMVGAIFTRWVRNVLWIDNFVLSCRVLARGVESACLVDLLTAARQAGAARVVGVFRPTAKNRLVAELYPEHGFVVASAEDVDGTVHFEHPLSADPEPVAHVAVSSRIHWPVREEVPSP